MSGVRGERQERDLDAQNVLSGSVFGPAIQARTVEGGIHLHQAEAREWPRPAQLPPAPAHFAGRRREQERLHRLIGVEENRQSPAIAVVSGPGGVGKTALALQVLHRLAQEFPDGHLHADLGGHDPERPVAVADVLGRFLRAFGVRPEHVPVELEELTALYRSLTHERQMLVLADNALSAAQVRPLLPASGASVVVVTSRRRLGLLAADGARHLWLDPLTEEAAISLLEEFLADDRVLEERESAGRLADLCGRFPLALAVAAARLASRPRWSIGRFVDQLAADRRRFDELTPEEEPVQAAFELSYAQLAPDAAYLYRTLGLHPGPDADHRLASAAAGWGEARTGAALAGLIEANLLDEQDQGRYRFHDLIRLHARAKAHAVDREEDRAATLRRIADFYLLACDSADREVMPARWPRLPRDTVGEGPATPDFSGPAEAMDWMEGELPNLTAVLRAAATRGWHALASQLVDAMWSLFLHRKLYRSWISTHQVGLASAEAAGDPAAVAMLAVHLGLAYRGLRDRGAALECFTRAYEVSRSAGDLIGEASALNSLGLVLQEEGRIEEAAERFARSVELQRQTGSLRGAALALTNLGAVHLSAGALTRAVEELEEAGDILRAAGDVHNEARAAWYLGLARQRAGDHRSATELLRRAQDLADAAGAPMTVAEVLSARAGLAEEEGDFRQADDLLAAALALLVRLDAPQVTEITKRREALRNRQENTS